MNKKPALTLCLATIVVAAISATVGFSMANAQAPAFPSVERVLTQELSDFEGKEVRMEVVTFAPGAAAPAHRHPGHVFVHVLEGQIISQLESGAAETYEAGATFYEPVDGLHAVAKNPSDSDTARILVVMIVDKDKPSLVIEPH